MQQQEGRGIRLAGKHRVNSSTVVIHERHMVVFIQPRLNGAPIELARPIVEQAAEGGWLGAALPIVGHIVWPTSGEDSPTHLVEFGPRHIDDETFDHRFSVAQTTVAVRTPVAIINSRPEQTEWTREEDRGRAGQRG